MIVNIMILGQIMKTQEHKLQVVTYMNMTTMLMMMIMMRTSLSIDESILDPLDDYQLVRDKESRQIRRPYRYGEASVIHYTFSTATEHCDS